MIVGLEGSGKSLVLRQMAIAGAVGMDPFTYVPCAPIRVLVVDCEVPQDGLYRGLKAMWKFAANDRSGADRMAVESRSEGIDLSRGADQEWLRKMVHEHQADLLCIGPVYRIADTDVQKEEGVRAWQRPLERLMSETGIGLLAEHHSGHGESGGKREYRPIGSSAIRRWFGQGIGMVPSPCKHGDDVCREACLRRAELKHWRGARDETWWPRHIRSVKNAPWWTVDEFADLEL